MSSYLIHTTYPILFVAVFGRQLCLPIPAILFLFSPAHWQVPASLAMAEFCWWLFSVAC